MIELGRLFIILGLFLLVFGALLMLFSKTPIGFGKLPGDIVFKRGSFTFYFPVATSLIISLLLTLILNFIFWLMKK